MGNFLGYVFAAVLLLCSQSLAAEAMGTALAVDVDARAEYGDDVRVLVAGADLTIGETVVTDAGGLVQIKFSDETELVVGPNSELVLEDYLLRDDGSVGKLAINALAGSFRFVTGTSGKDRYAINTPNGTIGVRGTAFDFFVALGMTRVLMFHGTTILCGTSGSCVTIAGTCEVGQTDSQQSELLGASFTAGATERQSLQQSFRFANNQQPLLELFRIDEVPECQLSGPTRVAAASISAVLGVCGPVIGEQYSGDAGRWGECGAAVAGFVATATDQQVGDLAAALAELFDPDKCKVYPTELPEAIYAAAAYASGTEQQQAIREIADTLRDCTEIRTSSIQRPSASPT